jgi:hypothetical protein
VGSRVKQMIKRKAREGVKKSRKDLRSVCRAPLFILATPDGRPLLREVEKGGERVTVTWCFTTPLQAEALAHTLGENYDEPITTARLPANEFLSSLLHHITQADIDFLILDEDTELPLSTMGVHLLDNERWTDLLNQTRREMLPVNYLLITVVMDVLQAASPASAVVVETATYADLVHTLLGPKGRLPGADLGVVWMLSSAIEGGTEPIFLKLTEDSPDNVSDSDLAIGPMFFTNYHHALNWPKVLPPSVAVHLADLKLHLIPNRGMNLLHEVNDNFPTANITEERVEECPECLGWDDFAGPHEGDVTAECPTFYDKCNCLCTTCQRKPVDVFLIDGGCLPMTLAGAQYTDELAYGEDKPEECFTTIAERDLQELRAATVQLLARTLGITLVQGE